MCEARHERQHFCCFAGCRFFVQVERLSVCVGNPRTSPPWLRWDRSSQGEGFKELIFPASRSTYKGRL